MAKVEQPTDAGLYKTIKYHHLVATVPQARDKSLIVLVKIAVMLYHKPLYIILGNV